MKRFKYIAIPAILAVAFACSKDIESQYSVGQEIVFDASMSRQQTKGTTQFPQTSDFGVTAFHTQGADGYQYFGNVQVTYSSGESKWKTASTLYWPKGAASDGTKLEFRGYSPYAAAAESWCTFPTSTSLEGSYTFEPAQSPDLMYSNPVAMSPASASGSPVGLTFNHALGQTTFTFTCARFDDSIEKGTMTVMGQTIELYNTYTEKASPTSDIEEKSFVFLSGNFPHNFGDGSSDYERSQQAFDLKNPIQNIVFVEVTDVSVNNLAWAGELSMTTADGSAWTKPANSVWTSPSDRKPLQIIQDPFYFSPNTKGFGMPFGTYVVLPQDLEPVISSQKPTVSINLNFKLFRAEENAANDSETQGDVRSQIFDYRDVAQYYSESDVVDGNVKKSGDFTKWNSETETRTFPNGVTLQFGKALLREDATPIFEISKAITLPLYDSKTANPRYLKMNTNTTYSIVVDPFDNEITFSPTVDEWLEQSAGE